MSRSAGRINELLSVMTRLLHLESLTGNYTRHAQEKQRHFGRPAVDVEVISFIYFHRDVVGFDDEGSFVRPGQKMETNSRANASLISLAAGRA